MLNLAVAYRQETFERIRSPLAERGIRVRHVPSEKRTFDLETPPWTPDEFDVGFVYPSRMMEGGVVDGLLSVPWVNGREAVLTSRNKGGVIARLGRAGIPVPKTVVVSNPVEERELRTVFEKFDSPVVVKPNSTTRGTGIAKVADLDSFLGVVDYLNLVHDYRATGDESFLSAAVPSGGGRLSRHGGGRRVRWGPAGCGSGVSRRRWPPVAGNTTSTAVPRRAASAYPRSAGGHRGTDGRNARDSVLWRGPPRCRQPGGNRRNERATDDRRGNEVRKWVVRPPCRTRPVYSTLMFADWSLSVFSNVTSRTPLL